MPPPLLPAAQRQGHTLEGRDDAEGKEMFHGALAIFEHVQVLEQ